ncbi:MAG: hypothetical protein WCF04_08775 [Candidatus Nanopelagicales bacterium]
MTWHVDAELLGAYAAGTTDGVISASIEQHVLRCATCRAGMAAVPPVAVGLEAVWSRVRDQIEVPGPTLVERIARRLRVPPSEARLLAATPSLTPSWFAGLAAVVGLALVAATYGRGQSLALFLLVAPLLPLLGVAASFDPTLDPSHEVASATPYPTFRLLLLRATAVLATSLPVVAVTAALLPATPWVAVGWLLPALAFSLAVLALAPWVALMHSAAAIAAIWAGAVIAAGIGNDVVAVVRPALQPVYLSIAVAAGVLLIVQAHRLNQPGGGSHAHP